jgi:hypothetical protein
MLVKFLLASTYLLDVSYTSPLKHLGKHLLSKTQKKPRFNAIFMFDYHVRVQDAFDREHDCYNSFTLCRGCTLSPQVA